MQTTLHDVGLALGRQMRLIWAVHARDGWGQMRGSKPKKLLAAFAFFAAFCLTEINSRRFYPGVHE